MQTNQQPPKSNGLSSPAEFRSKLGTYLSGVVIGFTLLGMIYLMKYYATHSPSASDTQPTVPAQSEGQP